MLGTKQKLPGKLSLVRDTIMAVPALLSWIVRQSVRNQWPGKGGAWTFPVTPMPVFYLTLIWCSRKKVTTVVNKIKMKKGHCACNAEQISQGNQNEREKGTIILLCGYISPFMETMWEFSIFAGQLPRGLWKQFRREIKGLQNRFQAWMIKWTFCKTDFYWIENWMIEAVTHK